MINPVTLANKFFVAVKKKNINRACIPASSGGEKTSDEMPKTTLYIVHKNETDTILDPSSSVSHLNNKWSDVCDRLEINDKNFQLKLGFKFLMSLIVWQENNHK